MRLRTTFTVTSIKLLIVDHPYDQLRNVNNAFFYCIVFFIYLGQENSLNCFFIAFCLFFSILWQVQNKI